MLIKAQIDLRPSVTFSTTHSFTNANTKQGGEKKVLLWTERFSAFLCTNQEYNFSLFLLRKYRVCFLFFFCSKSCFITKLICPLNHLIVWKIWSSDFSERRTCWKLGGGFVVANHTCAHTRTHIYSGANGDTHSHGHTITWTHRCRHGHTECTDWLNAYTHAYARAYTPQIKYYSLIDFLISWQTW